MRHQPGVSTHAPKPSVSKLKDASGFEEGINTRLLEYGRAREGSLGRRTQPGGTALESEPVAQWGWVSEVAW